MIVHDEIVFDSASVADNVPVWIVNVSAAAVSRKLRVVVEITGASLTAETETVKVALADAVPGSVVVTVNVSLAFAASAWMADVLGA